MVNMAVIVGRIGKDPEVRYTPSGAMVTSFSLATDESYKDKSGTKQKKTEWHNIVTFGKLAEICGNYLEKGKLVFIRGKIQTQSWEDKDGNKKYKTEIIADEMKILSEGHKKESGANGFSFTAEEQKPSDEDVPF